MMHIISDLKWYHINLLSILFSSDFITHLEMSKPWCMNGAKRRVNDQINLCIWWQHLLLFSTLILHYISVLTGHHADKPKFPNTITITPTSARTTHQYTGSTHAMTCRHMTILFLEINFAAVSCFLCKVTIQKLIRWLKLQTLLLIC